MQIRIRSVYLTFGASLKGGDGISVLFIDKSPLTYRSVYSAVYYMLSLNSKQYYTMKSEILAV